LIRERLSRRGGCRQHDVLTSVEPIDGLGLMGPQAVGRPEVVGKRGRS
jgi:hypothetical protein